MSFLQHGERALAKKDRKKKEPSIWDPKPVPEPAEEKPIELSANNVLVTDGP